MEEKDKGPAYKCLETAIANSEVMIQACASLIDALEKNPELDPHMCKAFGIRSVGPLPK